jgi:membrane protein YqaA with SNARE-associated domain
MQSDGKQGEAEPAVARRATAANAWLHRVVQARYAQLALFGFAFLEATALPIPIEAVMVPFMQMRRDIIWRIALIALAGFLASALLGYLVGSLLYEAVGARVLAWMGWTEQFEAVQTMLAADGFWAMLAIGLTPLPTQALMIGAGSIGVPFEQFVAAVIVARSLRYFGVAMLVWLYGDRIVEWFARRSARGARISPDDDA